MSAWNYVWWGDFGNYEILENITIIKWIESMHITTKLAMCKIRAAHFNTFPKSNKNGAFAVICFFHSMAKIT